jgi:hypothetical protein
MPKRTTLGNLLIDTTGELKEQIYDYIHDNLSVLYEEKKENYLKIAETDDGLYSVERDQFLTMFAILNNFDSFRNMHYKEIKKNLSELKDDSYNEEGVGRKAEEWNQDLGEINPIENTDPLIYSIIKGLPDLPSSYTGVANVVNRGVYTGLPQTGDFNRNWNILLDTLGGIATYDEMIQELTKVSKDFPQFKYMLDQLPKSVSEENSPQDLQIIQALVQSIGVEFVPYSLSVRKKTLSNGKPGFEANIHVLSTTATKKIKAYLDNDFKHNENRAFRTIKNGEVSLDLVPVLEKYRDSFFNTLLNITPKIGEPTMIDFLSEVFGMDFTPFMGDKDFGRVRSKINAVGIELYKRIYFVNEEMPSAAVRSPLGLLGKQYDEKTILEYQEKYAKDKFLNNKIEVGTKVGKVGPIINFNNDLDQLYTYYDKFYKIYGDKAYLNTEKNLQFSIVPYNHIFYAVQQINNAKNKEELALNPQTLPLVSSTFSKYSYFMKKLFREDGTKNVNSGGNSVMLSAINWAGPTILKETATSGKGKKSSNLTSQEKFVNDFLSFIKGNVFENLRFGEKNTSMALVFNGSKSDKIQFAEATFMADGHYLSLDYQSQLLNYLAYELEIYFNASESDKKKRRFIIFSNLLSKELQEKILSEIAPLYTPETAFTKRSPAARLLFSEEKGSLREQIVSEAEDFFKDEVKKELKALAYAIIPDASSRKTEDLLDLLKLKLSEIFQNNLTKEEVERKMLYYVANYFTHQIEVTHLFTANPRNYQKTDSGNFREIFKRLGLTSSPGRQPRLSTAWINSYNKYKSRDLEVLSTKFSNTPERGDLGKYNNTLRMTVFNDVFTNKNNKDTVIEYYKLQIEKEREALGKNSLTEKALEKEALARYEDYTNQKKEADAQAWGNLDFIRFYLDSIRRWTTAHEAAYLHEKKILEKYIAYKKEKDNEKKIALWSDIQKLKYEASYGQFPSLKLGFYGSAIGFSDSTTAGKFSVHTILPSLVIGSDLEDVMMEMLTKRVDIATFQSGSKLDFPAVVADLYDTSKDVMTVNPIEESNIATFSIEGLREQQYIAPKFKEEATLGTQFVKLIFGDFYEAGEFSEDFPEEVKNLIQQAQNDFTSTIRTLVNIEKENLAYESGVTLVDGQITNINKERFYKWLQKQGESRDTTEDFINFTKAAYDYSLGLDSVGFRNFVESVLTSVVNKRIIRPKIFGEPYIQTASTGYSLKNSRFTNPTKEQLAQYGTNNLRDNRVEDGKVQPADCKIAFNPNKHSGLLNLEWLGDKILTIERLNQALLDEDWVNQHSSKLILIGVRIPTQKFNSMEYMRVREFLPTSAGAIIIVPPSIVTKSGSDFDIDKLFMYEPSIDSEGELINSPVVSKVEHQRELDYHKQEIDEINRLIEVASSELISLPEYQKKEELKAELEKIKIEEPKLELSEADLNKVKGKTLSLEELQMTFQQQNQSQSNFKQGISDILREIAKIKKQSSNMVELYNQIEQLKTLKNSWYESRNMSKDKVTNGIKTLYNKILSTTETVLSNPALFEELTKPNNNNIIIPTIKKFYRELNKSIDSPINGTKVFLPSTSTLIHKDTLESKKSHGIVAKMNALHKLYQQTGLRFSSPLYNMYFLDGLKKNNQVVLGSKYTKDVVGGKKVLVSDILSQFVNGHVDIGNEDFINRIKSDQQRSPLYMQMTIQGTSLDTQIIVMMQPIINEYFAKVSDNLFKQILYPSKGSATEADIYANMLNSLVTAVNPKLLGETIEDTVINILNPTQEYGKILRELSFEESWKKYPISDSGIQETKYSKALYEKNIPYLKIQLAIFAQLYVIQKQNEALVTLNSNIDFNTLNFQTLQSMYNNQRFLVDGEIDGVPIYEIFESTSLEKTINESILSPFKASEFGVSLYSRFYEVTGHPNYLSALYNHYKEEKKDIYGYEFLDKYVNKFNNDFILSVLQNYYYEGNSMMDIYPKSLFEKDGLVKTLSDFRKNSSPELKKLFNTNNFLKYLRMRETDVQEVVNGKLVVSRYYFPIISVGNASKESKDDFIAQLLSLKDAKFSDLDLEQSFQEFIDNLAMSTIIHKGFISKLNTIQPFTSYVFYSYTLNSALDNFQKILNNPAEFSEYFEAFSGMFIAMNKKYYNAVPDLKDFTILSKTRIEDSAQVPSEESFEQETGPSFLENRVATSATASQPVANIPQNKISGLESYGSTVVANPTVIKSLGKNAHSIDMIEAGFRTRTTRSGDEMAKYKIKVGDTIKHFGKSVDGSTKEILARVTAIHLKGSPGWKGTWKKEGWRLKDVNVIERFKEGAAAIEFEVIQTTKTKEQKEIGCKFSPKI